MRNSQPTSFWDEAAARAQAQGPRAENPPEQSKPDRKPLRREPPPAPLPLVATDNQLRLRLAEELEYARRLLDAMGDKLAGDTAIIMRHGTTLQSVDIVGQILGHIADVVRCSAPEDAVERIGMAELKGRLKRRSIL